MIRLKKLRIHEANSLCIIKILNKGSIPISSTVYRLAYSIPFHPIPSHSIPWFISTFSLFVPVHVVAYIPMFTSTAIYFIVLLVTNIIYIYILHKYNIYIYIYVYIYILNYFASRKRNMRLQKQQCITDIPNLHVFFDFIFVQTFPSGKLTVYY